MNKNEQDAGKQNAGGPLGEAPLAFELADYCYAISYLPPGRIVCIRSSCGSIASCTFFGWN